MCKHQIVGKENFQEFAWKAFRFKFKFRDFPRVILTLPRTTRPLFSHSICVAQGYIRFKLFMSVLRVYAILRMKDARNQEDLAYRKSSIKPPGGLIYFHLLILLPFEVGGGGLFTSIYVFTSI